LNENGRPAFFRNLFLTPHRPYILCDRFDFNPLTRLIEELIGFSDLTVLSVSLDV
jgi:hypothetical protein